MRDHAVLRMLCVLTVLTAFAMMPVMLYGPPHLDALAGGGFWLLGWVWALLNLAAVAGSLLVEPLLRGLRREWMLLGLTVTRAGFLTLAALAGSLGPVVWMLVLYELTTAARQPVVTAWMNEHVGSELRATVLSVGGMAFMLGGALGLTSVGVGRARLRDPGSLARVRGHLSGDGTALSAARADRAARRRTSWRVVARGRGRGLRIRIPRGLGRYAVSPCRRPSGAAACGTPRPSRHAADRASG